VEEKELSNLYLDLSKNAIKKIDFSGSHDDFISQLYFFDCILNSLNFFADEINQYFDQDSLFASSNCINKWKKLSEISAINNIVLKEISPNGFIDEIISSKKILLDKKKENLIISNNMNDLKKYKDIINKYGEFIDLLRKILNEC